MKTAVIYWSGTGNTEAMARAVAEGMTAAGAEAVLLTPAEVQPGDLNTYGAIAFGCPAMGAEVLAAAKAAQCDAFVSKLPEGYHTLIGENGSRLSGGERQRISIARAILKDAPVILLDEATASLDVENETAVQAALSGLIKDKTVLIIAHRMRTVMNADQIVLLSGGRVVEMGSPAELLKKNGLFRHMAQLQSESMEWTA